MTETPAVTVMDSRLLGNPVDGPTVVLFPVGVEADESSLSCGYRTTDGCLACQSMIFSRTEKNDIVREQMLYRKPRGLL